MIGDRQRIAILTISEQELPFVIGAPKFVGTLAQGEVPCARRRKRTRRSTKPWRSSSAWLVLLAGILIPENRRIRRSRHFRSHLAWCFRFTFMWLFALRNGRL